MKTALDLFKTAFFKLDKHHLLTNRQIFFYVIAVATIMISGLDIYLSASIVLAQEFGASDYLIKLTLAVSPLSSFLVCIPAGYFSDRFGRRKIYICSMILFASGAAVSMVAPNIAVFFMGRFLLSFGAGSLSVLSGAIIADLFTGRELAKYMGFFGALFPAVFTLAPILGGQLLTYFGWRSIFLFLFLSMGGLCFVIGPRMPETRHRRLDKDVQNTTLSQESQSLFRKLRSILENPKAVTLALSNALPISAGALFTFNSPFLFMQTYAFTHEWYTLIVATPVLFQFVGAMVYRAIVQRIGPQKGLALGKYPCYFLLVSVAFMLGGWLPENPYLIIATMSMFTFGSTWIISSSVTLLLDSTDQDKGLLNSLLSLTRNGSIFLVMTAASYFVEDSIAPIFMTIGGVAVLIIVLIHLSVMLNFNNAVATSEN